MRARRTTRGAGSGVAASSEPGTRRRETSDSPRRRARQGRRDGQCRLGLGIANAGHDADDDEGTEDGEGEPRPANGQDAEAGPDREGYAKDEDLEGQLVGRPEGRDHELLGAGRLEVDDDAADGQDRRRMPGRRPARAPRSRWRSRSRRDRRMPRGRPGQAAAGRRAGSSGHRTWPR
jgi:hypothetical protein